MNPLCWTRCSVIHLFIYLFVYSFVCRLHLFLYLFTYFFIRLFTGSFAPPTPPSHFDFFFFFVTYLPGFVNYLLIYSLITLLVCSQVHLSPPSIFFVSFSLLILLDSPLCFVSSRQLLEAPAATGTTSSWGSFCSCCCCCCCCCCCDFQLFLKNYSITFFFFILWE